MPNPTNLGSDRDWHPSLKQVFPTKIRSQQSGSIGLWKGDNEPENVIVEISYMSVTGNRVAILGGKSHDPSKLAIFLRF